MFLNEKSCAAVVMVALCFVQPALAESAIERLEKFFAEVRTLEAEFTQRVFGEDGELVQESSGSLRLMRPGRFRWEYQAPDRQLILADGEKLWIYDPELEQATVKTIENALGAAPIMLLTGSRPLHEEFRIESLKRREGLKWVELRPKVRDTEFNRVTLGLDEDGVKRMVLHDQFGQTTIIRLSDVRSNTEIAPGAFEFDPPAGTDVLNAGG